MESNSKTKEAMVKKKAVRKEMVQNGSKTDHVEHLGALGFEMVQNAAKTAPFGVSELPWARNGLKCNRNYAFGVHVSGRPWARNGSERIQNGTKTNLLEHLDGLGSKIERNGTETVHLEHLGGLGPKMIQNGTEVPRERGRKLSKVAWGREPRRGMWEVCLNAKRLVIVSVLT